MSVLSTFLSLGLSLILVTNMEDKLSGRIIGSVLPSIVIGVIIFVAFWAKCKCIHFSYWKYTMKICLPYIPHLLSMTVLNSTDRIMITKMCGATDTALYSLAYTCGSMMTILLNSINTAFSPWLAERLHENDTKSVRSFSKYYITAFVCVSLGAMMIAPEILYIYWAARNICLGICYAAGGNGLHLSVFYTMMVNIEQIKGKTVGMAFASVAAAVLNYILNLLIPKFGYIAAAYTTLVGYLLLLGLHMWLVHRMGMSHVYSYRFVVGIVIVSLVFMIGMTLVYANIVIRYILVIGYIAVLGGFLKRKFIMSFINTFRTKKKKTNK